MARLIGLLVVAALIAGCSPDYNAAHRDHLHLDAAERGAMGFTVCR